MQEINKEAIQSGSLFADVMDNVNGNFENIETNFTMVENMMNKNTEDIEDINKAIQAGGFVCGSCQGSLPDSYKKGSIYELKVNLGFKPKFVILTRPYLKTFRPTFITNQEFDESTLSPMLTDNGFTLFYCNESETYPFTPDAIDSYYYIASRYEGLNFHYAELTERVVTSEV